MSPDKSLIIQAYRIILTEIFNGIYPYNRKLPSLGELCSLYNVGRNTMRSALLLLQENGYITLQRGVKATVIFHHDDEKLHQQYKQIILDSKQKSHDVFETMKIILPSIGVECFQHASTSQINELKKYINDYSVESIQTEDELIRELFNIYSKGFSMLNNPILDDLITTLLYSIYHPRISCNKNSKTAKYMSRIQNVLKVIIKTSQTGNSFIVKNMIAGLCLSYGKILDQYTDRECIGMTVKNEQKFVWSVYYEEDYLYMQVVFSIVNDINNLVYKDGDLLPSISQMSLKYNVSDRTSRRALQALRDYKIIEVINGVGSKVKAKQISSYKCLLKYPEIKANIEKYLYASQLLVMMNSSVIPLIIHNHSTQQLNELVDNLRNYEHFSIAYFLNYVYEQTNQCLFTIYKEIEKSRMWGLFANMFGRVSTKEANALKEQLLQAIENKDIRLIEDITNKLITMSTEVALSYRNK